MTPENPNLPDWARQERGGDLAWIRDNVGIFEITAKVAYQGSGRGAIVVDTTTRPASELGHPFGYFTQEQIEEYDDEDIKRMVREYDPEEEIILVLLKVDDRTSTYRVRPQQPE